MKVCTTCQIEQPLAQFSPSKRGLHGVQSKCKSCYAEMMRIKRSQNPEDSRAKAKAYRKEKYQKVLASNRNYREKNKEKVSAWKKYDRERNKARILADCAYRRAAIRHRTVVWADKEKIRQLYQEAQQIMMLVGEWFHVDHIIPLMGKDVCGLHIHTNLQIIPAIDNLKKGVSYEK